MAPKKTRAAAAKTQKASTVPASLAGKKLKIVLSSSSSSESLEKAPVPRGNKKVIDEEGDEDEIELEDEELEVDDDQMEEDEMEEDDFDEDSLGEPEEILPQKMTKRQKAVLDYNYGMDQVQMPSAAKPKEKEEITEEEALRRAEKTRRRQAQRNLKMEESKQATINRLLQKHGARSKKMKASQLTKKNDGDEADTPSISSQPSKNPAIISFIDAPLPEKGTRYKNSAEGALLIVTDDEAFNSVFAGPAVQVGPVTCAVAGCKGIKKYVEPQSCKPVCSLDCYRKIVS